MRAVIRLQYRCRRADERLFLMKAVRSGCIKYQLTANYFHLLSNLPYYRRVSGIMIKLSQRKKDLRQDATVLCGAYSAIHTGF